MLLFALLPEVKGRIAMLEMGEPVSIADLAKNLLELSGVRRVSGNHIVYTGLRPGERLHEELTAPDEQTFLTAHQKVQIVKSRNGSGRTLLPSLPQWERTLEDGDYSRAIESMAA